MDGTAVVNSGRLGWCTREAKKLGQRGQTVAYNTHLKSQITPGVGPKGCRFDFGR